MTKVIDTVFVGIDVSACTLVVALERDHQPGRQRREFPNTAAGHKVLIQWLSKSATAVQVCLEATGLYSLDLALALDRAEGIEVMVANPRAIADFAKALLQRSKTDQLDAEVMLEFARRMPFIAWQPPSSPQLDLRALMRRITGLKLVSQQEKNRLHSVSQSAEITPLVRKDIQSHLVQLERHIKKLEHQAETIVQADREMARQFCHLVSVRGIARVSALHLLAELVVLAPDMTARQWVAHAGLDPRHHESGTSVHKPTRISRAGNRYLRSALFMPALVATQHDPNIRAFYQKLLDHGKTKMQAIVAVMRKLLHALHGMLRTDSDFVGEKFFVIPS
jgi:transposase